MKVFLEEQRFTQIWIFIGLSFVFLITGFAIANEWEEIKNEKTGVKITLVASILLTIGLIALILFSRLKTRIDEFGVRFQYVPFHISYKKIKWNEISKAYTRKFNAITEYGGWGIKGGFRKKIGKSFTVKGNVGLQLELKNGRKILIGTQKKEEIDHVLATYKHKIIHYEN